MVTFCLDEQITLQNVELPYLISHLSLLKSRLFYFIIHLQLNTENLTLISNTIPLHLFTNIPEDFSVRWTDYCLFRGSMLEGGLEIGWKGIELEEASKAYVLKLMKFFMVVYACE
jgi:hypothetical protein